MTTMRINEKMRALVQATPRAQITKYQAFIRRAEREEAIAGLKKDGWEMTADNEFLMAFAKVGDLGVMVTVLDYAD